MPFYRRQGAYHNTSGMVFGSSFVPPFAPSDIGGLTAWFDMQDAGSFSSAGGFITAITNKASGVVWTEPTNRPALQSAGMSGKPCMYFDGNDRIISTETAVIQAVGVGSAYTIFYVIEPDVVDSDETVFAIGNSASNTTGIRGWGKKNLGTGSWSLTTVTDANATIVSFAPVAVPGVHVHCWHASASDVTHELNSGAVGSVDIANSPHASGATTCNRAALGCRVGLTTFFRGKIGELLIFDSRLSAADILRVTGYLQRRWPITQLRHVLCQGDSITAGQANSVASELVIPGGLIRDVATGGRKAWNLLNADIDAEMIPFRASGSVISWLLIGSNDGTAHNDVTGTSYSSVAQFLSDLANVVARLRAAQIPTVVGTVLYRAPSAWGPNPNFNGWVDSVNSAIRGAGDGGIYGDFIEDVGADMAAANGGGYSLYLADGVHPTAFGQTTVVVPAVQRGLDRAIAALGF